MALQHFSPMKNMSSKTLAVLTSLVLTASYSFAQTATATTDPVGFTTLSIPVGTSLVVPTLNNSSVYTGMATISADGLTITPTIAPGWTAGAYAKTALAAPAQNYPAYYAEVIAGAQEGYVIDITTNTATALTSFANEVTAASGLRGATVQIALRQHMTLDKLIVGATGLTGFSDGVSIYNSDGSQSVRFYDGTSFVDGSFSNPAGQTIIYPGTGFVITVSQPVTLTFLGAVKTTKTQVPLFPGATNIVGPQNPSSPTLLSGNTALAASLSPYADGVNNFSANGLMSILGAYFSDGTNVLDGSFSPLAPNAPDAIALNRGIVVTVGSPRVWTINPPTAP